MLLRTSIRRPNQRIYVVQNIKHGICIPLTNLSRAADTPLQDCCECNERRNHYASIRCVGNQLCLRLTITENNEIKNRNSTRKTPILLIMFFECP